MLRINYIGPRLDIESAVSSYRCAMAFSNDKNEERFLTRYCTFSTFKVAYDDVLKSGGGGRRPPPLPSLSSLRKMKRKERDVQSFKTATNKNSLPRSESWDLFQVSSDNNNNNEDNEDFETLFEYMNNTNDEKKLVED